MNREDFIDFLSHAPLDGAENNSRDSNKADWDLAQTARFTHPLDREGTVESGVRIIPVNPGHLGPGIHFVIWLDCPWGLYEVNQSTLLSYPDVLEQLGGETSDLAREAHAGLLRGRDTSLLRAARARYQAPTAKHRLRSAVNCVSSVMGLDRESIDPDVAAISAFAGRASLLEQSEDTRGKFGALLREIEGSHRGGSPTVRYTHPAAQLSALEPALHFCYAALRVFRLAVGKLRFTGAGASGRALELPSPASPAPLFARLYSVLERYQELSSSVPPPEYVKFRCFGADKPNDRLSMPEYFWRHKGVAFIGAKLLADQSWPPATALLEWQEIAKGFDFYDEVDGCIGGQAYRKLWQGHTFSKVVPVKGVGARFTLAALEADANSRLIAKRVRASRLRGDGSALSKLFRGEIDATAIPLGTTKH